MGMYEYEVVENMKKEIRMRFKRMEDGRRRSDCCGRGGYSK